MGRVMQRESLRKMPGRSWDNPANNLFMFFLSANISGLSLMLLVGGVASQSSNSSARSGKRRLFSVLSILKIVGGHLAGVWKWRHMRWPYSKPKSRGRDFQGNFLESCGKSNPVKSITLKMDVQYSIQ